MWPGPIGSHKWTESDVTISIAIHSCAATVCTGADGAAAATMSAPKFVVSATWWMRRPQNLNWNIWFTPKNYADTLRVVNAWDARNEPTWQPSGKIIVDTRTRDRNGLKCSGSVYAYSTFRHRRGEKWSGEKVAETLFGNRCGRRQLQHTTHCSVRSVQRVCSAGQLHVQRSDEREHSNWFPFSIKFLEFCFRLILITNLHFAFHRSRARPGSAGISVFYLHFELSISVTCRMCMARFRNCLLAICAMEMFSSFTTHWMRKGCTRPIG